jgi:hypothetical protein
MEAAMKVWKYAFLFICLGIGVALCVGAISILRHPDGGPPAWFAAALSVVFFWGAFALSRWKA